MADEAQPTDDGITRRKLLVTMGAAALTTAGAAAIARAEGSQGTSSDSSSRGHARHPTDPDPKDGDLSKLFPDSFNGPASDSGDVKPFWHSFILGRNKISEAGWARQVTERDLPISTTMAGVNMRLNKGAVRELHWHQSAEWAFMLTGQARVTAVNENGKAFVDDIGPGDLWYFRSGIPHSIQGIGDDGCEFILAFDDGSFSEFETFLITDWMHHTPVEVLAKNFGLPPETFKPIPKEELYIFGAPLPASLAQDKKDMDQGNGQIPESFTYRLLAQKPDISNKSGDIRIVDTTKFPASLTVSAAHVILKPGGLRELHWHTNQNEWQYWAKGQGRMTVFTGGGKARTMDFKAGDVGYIQNTLPHYIENTGTEDLVFLELFRSPIYRDMSLTQWITHLPPILVKAHLGIDKEVLVKNEQDKPGVVPS